jgi:hypothetical protein
MNTVVTVASLASATAVAAPAVGNNSDQRLVDLFAKLKAAAAKQNEADAATERAIDKFRALRPPKPEGSKPPAEFAEYETITGGELKLLEATVPEHPLVVWFRDQDGRKDPAQDQWEERCYVLRIECGIADAEAAGDARYSDKMDIYDKLIATPVSTAAGLADQSRGWRPCELY